MKPNPNSGPDTSDREITFSRVFAAPREMVWEAMTNPQHVVNWWGPRGFSTTIDTMEVRVGGVWKHTMRGPDGVNYPNKSIFREVVKPERIVYSHGGGREDGPGATFVATWSFEALEPERTRLTVRMVFPSAEQRDFVAKEFGAVEGGKQTLMRLSEHLAAKMARAFVITREFAATREKMWRAWSERDQLMRWFGPRGFTIKVAQLDFRPGGIFHYSMEAADGKVMWGKFVYREIVPMERIVHVNSFSDPAGGLTRHPLTTDLWPLEMLTETTFAERNGKTTVTVRMLPLDATAEERRVFDSHHESMKMGWGGTLDQLAAYLATS